MRSRAAGFKEFFGSECHNEWVGPKPADASNREVADAAGVHDQGQISKLLARLERLGLLHNNGDGQPRGEPNAWALTNRGKEIAGATETQPL